MNAYEDFNITVPLNPLLCTMTFTPDDDERPKGVLKEGLFKTDFFSERIKWVEIPGFVDRFRLEISYLIQHDSGVLKFRDQNNNLAMVVVLNVNGERFI